MSSPTPTDKPGGDKKLIVWHRAMQLAIEVNRVAKLLPSHERFELARQMRTAAFSIPANIAEGKARSQRADFARFLAMARGSANELDTYFDLARRLGYVQAAQLRDAEQLMGEVGRMLTAMLRGLTPLRPPTLQ